MLPKNKEACTAAPLQRPRNLEHEANAFDLGNNEDDSYDVPASFMVTADHDPGRDDGGPLGWRSCWSGLVVVYDHPEPTWRTPMRRDTATAGGGVSGTVGPAGQTSNQARCAVSSTGLLWRQGVTGFAVPGTNKWSVGQYQHWSSRATALISSITHGFSSANPGCFDMVDAKRW